MPADQSTPKLSIESCVMDDESLRAFLVAAHKAGVDLSSIIISKREGGTNVVSVTADLDEEARRREH